MRGKKLEKQEYRASGDYKEIEEAMAGKVVESTQVKARSLIINFTDGSYLDVIKDINDVHLFTPIKSK